MSVAELNARERMLYDCDGNGQDDSLDTALGFEEDSNGNHEIDFWDSDTTVLRRVDSDGWKSTAERDQRLYLYRYFAGDRSVIIRYFVPPPGPADLTVRTESGRRLVTLAHRDSPGCYTERWKLSGRSGSALPGDRIYLVRLSSGREHIDKKVFWRVPVTRH